MEHCQGVGTADSAGALGDILVSNKNMFIRPRFLRQTTADVNTAQPSSHPPQVLSNECDRRNLL